MNQQNQAVPGFSQSMDASMPNLDVILVGNDSIIQSVDMMDFSTGNPTPSTTTTQWNPSTSNVFMGSTQSTPGRRNSRNQNVTNVSTTTPAPIVLTIPGATGPPIQQAARNARNNNMTPGTAGTYIVAPRQAPATIPALPPTTTTPSSNLRSPPPYFVTFSGLTAAHKQIQFEIPKHFFAYFNPPSKAIYLLQFNTRAMAVEIRMEIFTDFIRFLMQIFYDNNWIPFVLEVQFAAPQWIAQYHNNDLSVDRTNYKEIARIVSNGFNRDVQWRNCEKPQSADLHIIAKLGHLKIMLESTSEKTKVNKREKTVGTETDMMIFPAYYGDMLTEQMGNLHTKEMEINASFNTLQDNMARINITQDSVLDDLKEIQEKCVGLLNDSTFSDEYSATTKAVTATEEDMESLANAFNPCLANPNTDFDVYEEKLKQVLEYSISMYKNAHDAFTRLEDEKNSLGNKDKDKDKENRRSKRRSDDRKRPLSYNLNNLSKLEDIRNDLQRASASTSKEQELEQSAEECDTIGFMAFVDELKLILNSNPFTRLIPEPEPVVEPEPVKKEEADESNLDELPMEEEDFKDNIANDPFLSGWSGGFPDIKVEDIKNEDFMSFLNNYAENNGDVLVESKIESSYDLTNNPNYTNEQFIADVNGIFADLEN